LIHRDVKPDNILYTKLGNDYRFQLADFGLATGQQSGDTCCGTRYYQAPEVVLGTYPQSPKIDIWSLFVTMAVTSKTGGVHIPTTECGFEEFFSLTRSAVYLPVFRAMGQRSPDLRASAAQMLVKFFGGKGLSTPLSQVTPMPDLEER
jgi:serine/threonine protein kinase